MQVTRAAVVLAILWAASPGRADTGVRALFDGTDLSHWVVPEGDGGHWKVIDGVIDYDARSEAPGSKNLVTRESFEDFVLTLDWRIKATPYRNAYVRYVLPDGSDARDVNGDELRLNLPDSDSGVYLRDSSGKAQVNIWCWPIGSGELYGYRTDPTQPPRVRAGATPRTQADRPVGHWNSFEITLIGDRLTVVLNAKTVIDNAELPGIPAKGPIALQHHGGFKDGAYTGPPSLVQFRNIRIKPLERTSPADSPRGEPTRAGRPDLRRGFRIQLAPAKIENEVPLGRYSRSGVRSTSRRDWGAKRWAGFHRLAALPCASLLCH